MTTIKVIPEAALAQHIAVLGKTGSGKTFAAKAAIVEPLLAAGRRVAIVDPTDAWWGLRSSRDGKGPGFPILVLGGDHGDLPLPALGGAAVARLLVEQGVNLVASTKHLTVGERTRWFIDFAGTINRLNRSPLHLVLDEAHNFAPQGKVPDPDTGRMLHAANTLASGGRSIGIRLVMITQRPQKLHKDTLTSADTLIAMRVLAPHDRAAVEDWIKGCGDLAQGKVVLNSLAGLQRGEGWIWYPEGGFLERTKFPAIRTFDSSATPTDGHVIAAPKGAAEIDLTEVNAALADAVKEAEANDPKRLRARIAELERELRNAASCATVDTNAIERARQQGISEGHAQAIKDLQLNRLDMAEENARLVVQMLDEFRRDLRTWHGSRPTVSNATRAENPETSGLLRHRPEVARASGSQPGSAGRSTVGRQIDARGAPGGIDKAMPRAILTALAQHPDGLTKGQILIHTGYRSSGPVSSCFADLARNGWTEVRAGRVTITDAGFKALGPYNPLPTGADLRDHLLNGSKCSTMEKAMLRALFDAYPDSIGKGVILERTGYASSGPTSAAFARLVALGYASKEGRGHLRASERLFE